VRHLALGCVLLGAAARVALAQPAVGPDQPVTPVPAPPTPAPAPVTVTPEAPKPQTRTEARMNAQAACNAHQPCDWAATMSPLERRSLRRILALHGYELEPSPWGKTIRKVIVHNEEVFAEANWLEFFNIFHVTSKPGSVRAEVVVEDGEPWSDERVLESTRRLRDPLYSSIVIAVPVKTGDPDQVDLLVITRDVWSLRLNTKWDIQGSNLLGLTMSLSENNFLGRRKTVAVGLTMDQGAIAAGPLYIDKNFLGQHIDFRARVDKIFTRKTLDVFAPDGTHIPTGDPGGIQDESKLRSEGTAITAQMTKTLWSLRSTWGYGWSFSYRDSVSRSYLFTGVRRFDDPDTAEAEMLPREYRLRTWSARASATRQWGTDLKHSVEAGYNVSSIQPSLLDTPIFQGVDPTVLDHFRETVFARDEVASYPFVEYSLFEPRYVTVRNLDTYELAEDLRFGPSLSLGIAQTFRTLGSTYRFTRPSASAGWTFPWGRDGFARISAGGQVRLQEGETIDNTATGGVRIATPTLASLFRVLLQASVDTRWNDAPPDDYYTLGSDNGLRGYGVAEFFGDRRVIGQLEARSVPYHFWVLGLGGVVFYEGGSVASSFKQMQYFHDVGFGLRMLIPQSSRELFRFDLAFPLVTAQDAIAGHPRFLAGFDSYF
jgi:hypothetical protein